MNSSGTGSVPTRVELTEMCQPARATPGRTSNSARNMRRTRSADRRELKTPAVSEPPSRRLPSTSCNRNGALAGTARRHPTAPTLTVASPVGSAVSRPSTTSLVPSGSTALRLAPATLNRTRINSGSSRPSPALSGETAAAKNTTAAATAGTLTHEAEIRPARPVFLRRVRLGRLLGGGG